MLLCKTYCGITVVGNIISVSVPKMVPKFEPEFVFVPSRNWKLECMSTNSLGSSFLPMKSYIHVSAGESSSFLKIWYPAAQIENCPDFYSFWEVPFHVSHEYHWHLRLLLYREQSYIIKWSRPVLCNLHYWVVLVLLKKTHSSLITELLSWTC